MSADFRALALALPSSTEHDHLGRASFRVSGKIFAQLSHDGRTAVVKIPAAQQWLIDSYPGARSSPGRWGQFGWTEFSWADLPRGVLEDLLRQSWDAVASGPRWKRRQGSATARSPG
jgi:hypothetical protein